MQSMRILKKSETCALMWSFCCYLHGTLKEFMALTAIVMYFLLLFTCLGLCISPLLLGFNTSTELVVIDADEHIKQVN